MLCLAVAATVHLAAQPVKITIEEAVTKALTTSKMLKASDAKVTQASASVSEADASSLPSLTFSGNYTRLSGNPPVFAFDNAATVTQLLTLFNALPGSPLTGQFNSGYIQNAGDVTRAASANAAPLFPVILDNYQFRLTAQQVLYSGGRVDASKDMARHSTEAAKLDYANDKISLAYATRQAYWAMYRARELRKSLDETSKQLAARVKDAELMLKAGMITTNDVLKLKVSLSNINVQILDVDNQIRSAMVAMNNLLGLPLTTIIELSTEPQYAAPAVTDVNMMITNARSQRPDLLANEERIKMADAGITASKSGWFPTLAVQGNFLYANPNQRFIPNRPEFNYTWDLGVNLQWKIWDWQVTRYQTEQSEARYIQAVESSNALKDNVSVEVTQNYLSLSPAKERITVSDESVSQAQENYTVVENKYKAGTATSTDVLEAETLLLQSKINKLTAIVDYELALAKLNRSLGK